MVGLRAASFSVMMGLSLLGCSFEEPAFPKAPFPIQESPDTEARIARIVCSIPVGDDKRMSLAEAMATHRVPGVSAAAMVGGRIVWARTWGVADASRGAPALPTTMFQAASVSKAMTAVATMRMVEQGLFGLDDDVSELIDWEPALGGQRVRITPRQLLSHTSGLGVHGFGGYHRRRAEKLPGTLEILRGTRSNSGKISVEAPPGATFKYSGGGYVALQAVIEEATGNPFHQAMYEWLIRPLRMAHSTFEQPPLGDHLLYAATAHSDGAPVEGQFRLYPEGAAAGLWTTPSDLLRVGAWLITAFNGHKGPVSTRAVRAMWTKSAPNEDFGLGFALKFDGPIVEASHSGSNVGFTSQLILRSDGSGVAVMVNSDGPIARGLANAIGEEYGFRKRRAPACAP